MRKNAVIWGLGLLVWLLATCAFAGLPGLQETTWLGPITIVDSVGNLTSDNATLKIINDTGDFIAGTLTGTITSLSVSFGGLKDGRSLKMTGVDYLMAGEIFKGRNHKKGTVPTQTMMIEGSGLAEGIMFQGVLTQQ